MSSIEGRKRTNKQSCNETDTTVTDNNYNNINDFKYNYRYHYYYQELNHDIIRIRVDFPIRKERLQILEEIIELKRMDTFLPIQRMQ